MQLEDSAAFSTGINHVVAGGINRQGEDVSVSQASVDRLPVCSAISTAIHAPLPCAGIDNVWIEMVNRYGAQDQVIQPVVDLAPGVAVVRALPHPLGLAGGVVYSGA